MTSARKNRADSSMPVNLVRMMSDVDGGLIGGASLNANDFFAIVKSI